jgi:glucokinase
MHVIAADVGGTKTRLVFADSEQPRKILYEARYMSGEFDAFESMLHTFIKDIGSVGAIADVSSVGALTLALPGLVSDSSARLTNLPWVIEKQSLLDTFGIKNIVFMNDFQAAVVGTGLLLEEDRIILNTGILRLRDNLDGLTGSVTPNTTRVAVGAGTGLGVAWIDDVSGDENMSHSHDSEGGHIDFAPIDDVQVQLLQFLQKRFVRVSYERILSGDGLVSLYHFCAAKQGGADIHQHRRRTNTHSDSISAQWVNEQSKNNEAADRALSLFVQIYGAYIGNLAVLFKPYGGIFITGGIAAKMVKRMQSEKFINAYFNKGRMRTLVEQIAVYLVTNERVGVLGAMSEATK